MLGKMVDWMVRHYWAGEYIRKSEIRNVILQAREDEMNLQAQHYSHEMQRQEERLNNERLLMEESLKSEIARLNSLMSVSVKKVKRADDSYYQSLKALRRNRQLTGDVIEKMKELMNILGSLFGAVEDIERAVNSEIEQLEWKQ